MTSTMTIENGHKVWRNAEGKLHRTDGPAIEWAKGSKAWYVDGKQLTEPEFKRLTSATKAYEFLSGLFVHESDRAEYHQALDTLYAGVKP